MKKFTKNNIVVGTLVRYVYNSDDFLGIIYKICNKNTEFYVKWIGNKKIFISCENSNAITHFYLLENEK